MRRGFTLLEMLVAAFVLAVGLVGTLTLIGNSTRMTKEADDRARASAQRIVRTRDRCYCESNQAIVCG